jgi:hypothetical protein
MLDHYQSLLGKGGGVHPSRPAKLDVTSHRRQDLCGLSSHAEVTMECLLKWQAYTYSQGAGQIVNFARMRIGRSSNSL